MLQDGVNFEDETNPALILINMAKESAKYKTRMEEINGFNEVCTYRVTIHVDTKTEVVFKYMRLILKPNFCFDVNRRLGTT